MSTFTEILIVQAVILVAGLGLLLLILLMNRIQRKIWKYPGFCDWCETAINGDPNHMNCQNCEWDQSLGEEGEPTNYQDAPEPDDWEEEIDHSDWSDVD